MDPRQFRFLQCLFEGSVQFFDPFLFTWRDDWVLYYGAKKNSEKKCQAVEVKRIPCKIVRRGRVVLVSEMAAQSNVKDVIM